MKILRTIIVAVLLSETCFGRAGENPSDTLLEARLAIPKACMIVAAIIKSGYWPDGNQLVATVDEVHWRPNAKHKRFPELGDRLISSTRTGSLTIYSPDALATHFIEHKLSFTLSSRFVMGTHDKADGANLRENGYVVEDDPFIQGRSFACRLGAGPSLSEQLQDISPMPRGWPALLAEANRFRLSEASLFAPSEIALDIRAELSKFSNHQNDVIRCMIFQRLSDSQSVSDGLLVEAIKSSKSAIETAVKCQMIMERKASEPGFLGTMINKPGTSKQIVEGVALASYTELRRSGTSALNLLSEVSQIKAKMKQTSHAEEPAVPSAYADAISHPAVKLLVEIAKWNKNHQDGGSEIIPELLRITHLPWAAEP